MAENLELVRSIYADWERGNFRSAAWAHSEIEFVRADGLAPGAARGVGAMRESFFEGWLSLWEDYRIEAEGYREIDAERVLVQFLLHGRGKRSGIEIEQIQAPKGAHLFHVRDGKVTRLVNYASAERAVADLGLGE